MAKQLDENKKAVAQLFLMEDAKGVCEAFGSGMPLNDELEDDDTEYGVQDMMTVNPSLGAQDGEVFPAMQDDMADLETQRFVVDQFAEKAMAKDGNLISKDDIPALATVIQGTNMIKGNVEGFLEKLIDDANKRLSTQNVSDAQPTGAGIGASPVDPMSAGTDLGFQDMPGVPAEPSLDTNLDDGAMGGDLDFDAPGLDDGMGAEPAAEGDDIDLDFGESDDLGGAEEDETEEKNEGEEEDEGDDDFSLDFGDDEDGESNEETKDSEADEDEESDDDEGDFDFGELDDLDDGEDDELTESVASMDAKNAKFESGEMDDGAAEGSSGGDEGGEAAAECNCGKDGCKKCIVEDDEGGEAAEGGEGGEGGEVMEAADVVKNQLESIRSKFIKEHTDAKVRSVMESYNKIKKYNQTKAKLECIAKSVGPVRSAAPVAAPAVNSAKVESIVSRIQSGKKTAAVDAKLESIVGAFAESTKRVDVARKNAAKVNAQLESISRNYHATVAKKNAQAATKAKLESIVSNYAAQAQAEKNAKLEAIVKNYKESAAKLESASKATPSLDDRLNAIIRDAREAVK